MTRYDDGPDGFDVVEAFIGNFFLIVGTGWGLVIIWLFLPEPIQGPVLGTVIAIGVGVFFLVFFGGMAICVAMPFALLGRGVWSLMRRIRRSAALPTSPATSSTAGPAAFGHGNAATGATVQAVPRFLAGQHEKIVTVATPDEREELDRLLHVPVFSYAEQVFWQGLVHRWSEENPPGHSDTASAAAVGVSGGETSADSIHARLAARWEQRNQHRWAR